MCRLCVLPSYGMQRTFYLWASTTAKVWEVSKYALESVKLLDLQASIIVTDDVNDVNWLAGGVHPVWVLHLVYSLWKSMR